MVASAAADDDSVDEDEDEDEDADEDELDEAGCDEQPATHTQATISATIASRYLLDMDPPVDQSNAGKDTRKRNPGWCWPRLFAKQRRRFATALDPALSRGGKLGEAVSLPRRGAAVRLVRGFHPASDVDCTAHALLTAMRSDGRLGKTLTRLRRYFETRAPRGGKLTSLPYG